MSGPRLFAFALAGLLLAAPLAAAEPESCATVRMSDPGWTDITSTTAITRRLLTGLGYDPSAKVLAVPVTYQGLKGGSIDVFLGKWMPSMEADIAPFKKDGSVETLDANLPTGAKYTLIVPQYVYDAGVHDFADIAKFKDKFDGKEIVGWLRQRSRPYLFSNSIAPPVAAGTLTVLDLLEFSTELRDRLHANARYFRDRMQRSDIILVTHNSRTIRQYCDRGAVLANGRLDLYDDITGALDRYQQLLTEPRACDSQPS